MAHRVYSAYRIATDIGVGIHALRVTLHTVRAEKAAHHRVIVARIVVIQPADGVLVLPGEALEGPHAALLVYLRAIGVIDTVALHGGTAWRVAEVCQHTAQQVRQEEGGRLAARARLLTNQTATHAVVGRGVGVRARRVVLVLLQPKGVVRVGGRRKLKM